MTEVAILAGGCFWCLEAVFQNLKGVSKVESGYIGGSVKNPTYEQVCSGRTGHAEAVQVHYDPTELTYREVLEIFFAFHDPTTKDRQGPDVGTQYRSAIFPRDESQRKAAEEVIAELTRDGTFDAPIVTTIEPNATFYPAEAYHRDYYRRNSSQPYCALTIGPKITKLTKLYAERLQPS